MLYEVITGIGKEISDGKADFKSLETYALDLKEIENSSGMQEYLESMLNEYVITSYSIHYTKLYEDCLGQGD